MMKQRELGSRGRLLLHVVVALSMALTATAAGAEMRPVRTAHPQPVAETTHGRPSALANRRLAAKAPVRPALRKVPAGKSAVHAKSSHGAVVPLNARTVRTRRSARPERASEVQPISSHHAKAEPARNPRAEKERAMPASHRDPAADSDATAAQEPRPLTVDDFTRAAQGEDAAAAAEVVAPSGGISARGESHPDEDDAVSTPRVVAARPVLPKRPMVAAKDTGEDRASAPTDSVLADDRESPAATSRENDADADAALPRPATRQELTEELEQPVVLPGLYRNGRLVVPAPLKGTHEILVHQNLMADDEGLERIQDDDDLRRLRAAHLLVNFTESASLHVNPELAADRRCARAWTVRFANDIARSFYARFHEPLQVNSAVRTVAYQVRLQRTNGNAAGTDGEAASPHLTGQALDLGKRGMSLAQIAWMRAYLLPLMQAGKIDVEEEFQQACFHISVYRTYLPAVPAKRRVPRNEVAQLREPRVVKSAPRGDDLR